MPFSSLSAGWYDPKLIVFYMLPKVHEPNNPGGLVVCSVACHSSLMSKHGDFQFYPAAQRPRLYVRDTTDLISKLSTVNDLPNNIILIAFSWM